MRCVSNNRNISPLLAAATLAVIGMTSPAKAATIDFETAGDYSNNFRVLNVTGASAASQTSNGAANDYVNVSPSTSTTAVYDTTPSESVTKSIFTISQASSFQVTADVRFASATSSFGVYIINPADESKGYLALFNIDQPSTGTADLIRFASNAVPNTGGAGTLVSGATGEGMTQNVWTPVTLTYSIDANNNPVLAMSAGTLSSSITFDTITTPLTDFEVALRTSAQGTGTANYDNFTTVVPAPEPGTMMLLGLAGLPLLRRRRRS